MSRLELRKAFDKAIKQEGAEIQICLDGSGPMGPGPVEHDPDATGVYTIVTLATDGRQQMKYPVTFCFDDVRWFSTGPREDDKPMITIASPGSINPSRGRG